jgi:hypothetical protein
VEPVAQLHNMSYTLESLSSSWLAIHWLQLIAKFAGQKVGPMISISKTLYIIPSELPSERTDTFTEVSVGH